MTLVFRSSLMGFSRQDGALGAIIDLITILFEFGQQEGGTEPKSVLYYNIAEFALFLPVVKGLMTHHHHGGAPHPSPTVSPSLLRLSAVERLAGAGVLIALIWAAVFWATR